MLLLSTRLFLIASNYLVQGYLDKVKMPAPSIADKCNINTRALMPALRRLTQAGILNSQTGGREPGFIFARDPSIITVSEIIIALEGEPQMLSCRTIIGDAKCTIANCDDCPVYKSINNGIATMSRELKMTSLTSFHKTVSAVVPE